MTNKEKREYLIRYLLAERGENDVTLPNDEYEQRNLLRSLFNVRTPGKVSEEYKQIEGEYLREEIAKKGVTDYKTLTPIKPGIYLWQGDITTLKCGAIVNAANSGLTGCWQPLHNCIDNCIHTYAGVELRNTCDKIMKEQGHTEPTGKAKITPAYNLPCRYVIHTVGPIVNGLLENSHKELLALCYRSCLEIADCYNIESIAFCCISTGVFGFPQSEAAKIAIKTVEEYLENTKSKIEVIFNVFRADDYKIYRELLK